jgi:predicted transcriptional regulator
MPGNRLSRGATLVAALSKRLGASAIARKVALTEAAVRSHATGASTPRPGARKRYEKSYGVPSATWDDFTAPRSPRRSPARASSPAPTAPEPEDPTVDDEALDVARDTVMRLRKELDRLDADPAGTARERASVSTALVSATRLLARLSGALEITQSSILRSVHWSAIKVALVDALVVVPGGLEAMAKALRALDGQGAP